MHYVGLLNLISVPYDCKTTINHNQRGLNLYSMLPQTIIEPPTKLSKRKQNVNHVYKHAYVHRVGTGSIRKRQKTKFSAKPNQANSPSLQRKGCTNVRVVNLSSYLTQTLYHSIWMHPVVVCPSWRHNTRAVGRA